VLNSPDKLNISVQCVDLLIKESPEDGKRQEEPQHHHQPLHVFNEGRLQQMTMVILSLLYCHQQQ